MALRIRRRRALSGPNDPFPDDDRREGLPALVFAKLIERERSRHSMVHLFCKV